MKLAARANDDLLRDGALLGAALADARGVPVAGRDAEFGELRSAGYRDLAFGRLYEGHGNALSLVARCGTATQRGAAMRDATDGRLFGVWNTAENDDVTVSVTSDGRLELRGRKTFCSGAGTVSRALITAGSCDGSRHVLLVPLERVSVTIDRASWQPLGMLDSDSFAVDFTGVRLDSEARVGRPGDYERQPWFDAGAARFVAVQAGAIARLYDEFAAFAVRRGTGGGDVVQIARLGECLVAARGAEQWVDACVKAWSIYDACDRAQSERELRVTVDAARAATERAALDVLERVERGVGARGLLAPEPFAALVRDLRMYLRQPAPDLAISRVGAYALARAREA